MKKIPTLFVRDPETKLVIDQVTDGCQWVIDGFGVATRKWDGTACMIRKGILYKRFDAFKYGPPPGFIECQPKDLTPGHWPGWLMVEPANPANKWHIEAMKQGLEDGTYELCGPKINGNPERLETHQLIRHGEETVSAPRSFEGLKYWLETQDIEGVVWHSNIGMVKIKKRDFGFKR